LELRRRPRFAQKAAYQKVSRCITPKIDPSPPESSGQCTNKRLTELDLLAVEKAFAEPIASLTALRV